MSDENIYDDDDEPTTGIVVDRKVLLLILGGCVGLIVTLSILRARMDRKVTNVGPMTNMPLDDGWQASIEHLALAWEHRYAGIDERLEALANDRVQHAATSLPEPIAMNGEATVERVPPVLDLDPTQPEPPRPASVSLPPTE